MLTLEPVAIKVGEYESVRGTAPLPDGFKPRQTTIQVLDRVDGKRVGMRVINVKDARLLAKPPPQQQRQQHRDDQ
jgi:hypothetical protein